MRKSENTDPHEAQKQKYTLAQFFLLAVHSSQLFYFPELYFQAISWENRYDAVPNK